MLYINYGSVIKIKIPANFKGQIVVLHFFFSVQRCKTCQEIKRTEGKEHLNTLANKPVK